MHINSEIKRHFKPDDSGKKASVGDISKKTGVPAWKLYSFLSDKDTGGGNLFTDEFLRILVALGYKIESPEGDILYGGDADKVAADIKEHTL